MNILYAKIGKNIRIVRRQAGLTQEEVAERLRISTLHFGRIERGQRPASLRLLSHIADTLNVSMDTLLSGCIMDMQPYTSLRSSLDDQSAEHLEYALMLVDQFREQIQAHHQSLTRQKTLDS